MEKTECSPSITEDLLFILRLVKRFMLKYINRFTIVDKRKL